MAVQATGLTQVSFNKTDRQILIYKIGNYVYQFTRYERPNLIDEYINQIDIYNDNNIKLHTLKFDTDNADLIFLAMKSLYKFHYRK